MQPMPTIGGGNANQATGAYATVPGGDSNIAAGAFSWRQADAGCTPRPYRLFSIRGFKQCGICLRCGARVPAVRASGGVRFVTGVNQAGIALVGARLAPGSGSWNRTVIKTPKRKYHSHRRPRHLKAFGQLADRFLELQTQAAGIRHTAQWRRFSLPLRRRRQRHPSGFS